MPDQTNQDPWKTYQQMCEHAQSLDRQAQAAWERVDELTEGFCAPAATPAAVAAKLRFVLAALDQPVDADLPESKRDLHRRVLSSAIDDLEDMAATTKA
jgi:cation transport regulator ChaB